MFAIELHGEGEGETRLDELARRAHVAIQRPYQPIYRPHVSLGVFNADGNLAMGAAQKFAADISTFDLQIEGIGVFPAPPGVVYAAPVPTVSFLALHSRFALAFGASGDALIDYYRPGKWVPHATLLMPASATEQGTALSALASGWQPFAFRVSHLGIVRVPDAHVLAEFGLND